MRFSVTSLFALAASVSAGPLLDASIIGRSALAPRADSQFKNDCLRAHNDARTACGVKQLTWNNDIANWAQGYANQMARSLPGLYHSHRSGYGENLAANTDGRTYNMIWNQWVMELTKYSFNNPRFAENTGHFTQVVWAGTNQVGCAKAQGPNREWLLVCQYLPAGNVIWSGSDQWRLFRANVKPPRQGLHKVNDVVGSITEGTTQNQPSSYQKQPEATQSQTETTQYQTEGNQVQTKGDQNQTEDDQQNEVQDGNQNYRRHAHHKRILSPMR